MARKKKQPELPTLERPTVDAIDEKCAEHLEATSAVAVAKEAAKNAKAAMMAMLQEHRADLEEDKEKNHIYTYQDGDVRRVFVLTHDDGLRVRDDKKTAPEAQGEMD